jgi:hypothetical protein
MLHDPVRSFRRTLALLRSTRLCGEPEVGYVAGAARRMPGFFIQAFAVIVLAVGALGRLIYLAATSPA